MSFPHKCVKGCPTVVQLQIIIHYKLVYPGLSQSVAKEFKISYHSPQVGEKQRSPVLASVISHDFSKVRFRHKDENIQLNIELHQGADSGSLLAFVSKRMLSKIISKNDRKYYK